MLNCRPISEMFFTSRWPAFTSGMRPPAKPTTMMRPDHAIARKREVAFEKAFSRFESIIVVVNAPTAELAGLATTELAAELEKHTDRFKTVSQLGGGEFFARNGLMFQSVEELKKTVEPLAQAEPLITLKREVSRTLDVGSNP